MNTTSFITSNPQEQESTGKKSLDKQLLFDLHALGIGAHENGQKKADIF